MFVNIKGIDTTILIVVLVVLGLIVLLKGIMELMSKASQALINSKQRYVSYKAMLFALAGLMILMWAMVSQEIPHIDKYILSFWPLVVAGLTFFAIDKTTKAESDLAKEEERCKAEEDLKQRLESLEAKYEKEKAKNSKTTKRTTKK